MRDARDRDPRNSRESIAHARDLVLQATIAHQGGALTLAATTIEDALRTNALVEVVPVRIARAAEVVVAVDRGLEMAGGELAHIPDLARGLEAGAEVEVVIVADGIEAGQGLARPSREDGQSWPVKRKDGCWKIFRADSRATGRGSKILCETRSETIQTTTSCVMTRSAYSRHFKE